MGKEISAGCLVYKYFDRELRFLLVHPSGASFRRRLFGIPKGLMKEGEDMVKTAIRETGEESKVRVVVEQYLGSCTYKSGKAVHCYLARYVSGFIDGKGNTKHDWEVDVSKFYPVEQSKEIIHPMQEVFIDRALKIIKEDDYGINSV
jgi:predicted NUDIX family NTP pyrophosphohydrolase